MGASWCTNDHTIVVMDAENFFELLVSGGNEIYFSLLFLEEKNIF
jgi:hypothetical protein